MLQLKSFPKNTSIEKVNTFLSRLKNAKILSTSPILIQFEEEEIFEEPAMEFKGPPTNFEIITEDSKGKRTVYNERSGHILFLNNGLVMNTKRGGVKIDCETGDCYCNGKLRREFTCIAVGLDDCYNYYGRGYEIQSKYFFDKVADKLQELKILSTSLIHHYHQRTGIIYKVGEMQAAATNNVASATEDLAKATIIAGQMQALATSNAGDQNYVALRGRDMRAIS